MTTIRDQREASDPNQTLDERLLGALGSTSKTLGDDYPKAYVPQPTESYLHILQTQRFSRRFSPPASMATRLVGPCEGFIAAYTERPNDLGA